MIQSDSSVIAPKKTVMSSCLPCTVIWRHSFKVGWDGFVDAWQEFSFSPEFVAHVTVKVKASGMVKTCGIKCWQLLFTQVEQQFIGYLAI